MEAKKSKRGRKPGSKKANITSEPKVPKKRGRKPKGGKIITNAVIVDNNIKKEPNIILHLKCVKNELENNKELNKYGPDNINNDNTPLNTSLGYQYINNRKIAAPSVKAVTTEEEYNDDRDNLKNIWEKLKELSINLHLNNISSKKSDCHWCTYNFDNPPIYIPKYEHNGVYHVYGCFCSPECACAFLQKENIDSSAKFERLHFLNYLYCKIYDYDKNITPAPNPFYTLDKYYGNLTIQEYRHLFKSDRILLVIDKPLSRILPGLHEDNGEIYSLTQTLSSTTKYSLKKTIKDNKYNILHQNFGNK